MSDTAELVISCRSTGTEEVNNFTESVRRADTASNKLIKTTGMLFTTAQIMRFARSSVEAYKVQENASNSLRNALKRLGKDTVVYQREMEAFSSEMQKNSIYGDNQITMIQALGMNMGILPSKIQSATKAALGLSAAYNVNVNTAMMMIARASKGHTEILSRYGIILDKTKTKEEQFNQLLEIGSGNFSLVKGETETLSGAMQQASNVFGDAKEKIGAQFTPVLKTAAGLVHDLSSSFVKASEPTQRFIVLTGTLTSAMVALKGAVGAAGIARNIGGMLAGAGKSANANTRTNTDEHGLTRTGAGGLAAVRASAAAVKAGGAVGSGEALTIMRQEMQYKEQRALLLKDQAAAEAQSEVAAKRLQEGDRMLRDAKMRLEEARRGVRETGVDWQASLKSGAKPEEIESNYREFRYQLGQRTEAYKEYENQIIRVNELQKELAASNEAVMRSNTALKDFDKARTAERNYMLNQPGVRPAMEARNAALSSGMGAGEAEIAAQQVYAREVEKASKASEIASAAELKRAEALRLGATEAQADAVKTAYLSESQKALTAQANAEAAAVSARNAARAQGATALEAESAAEQAYNQSLQKTNAELAMANGATEARNAALARGASITEAAAVGESRLVELQRSARLAEKPREAAIKARNAALANGASVTAAEAAATKAYNQVQAEQAARATMSANAENAKNAALARGATAAQANAVKTAVLSQQQKMAAMSSTAFGRAQLAVAGGVRAAGRAMTGAAVAAKGLMMSMAPMLAISAVIAGIDYLMNRAKNAAKAMSEIASKEADAARAALARGDEERASDQEKFKRYEELAQYTDRTAEEQKELIALAGELNGRYKDMVLPILDQNTALSGTVDLWGKIREAQRKAREEQLKAAVADSNRQLEAETLRLQEKRKGNLDWGKRRYDMDANWQTINALPYQQRLAVLEQLRAVYKKSNNSEMFSEITNYIERLKSARKLQMELIDFRNGRGSLTGGKKAESSQMEDSKRIRSYMVTNQEKRDEEYFNYYGKLREIYQLEGDRAKRKKLLNDLDKDNLDDLDDEIKKQQKLYNQQSRSKNKEDREKSLKTAERLVELTRQRGEVESNQVRREFEEAQKADQENRQFFSSIQQSLFRFRETAGNAINANSNEAIRMQSRQFIGGGESLNFAKLNAENSKKIGDVVKRLEEIEKKVFSSVDKIRETVTDKLKTSTAGG